MDHVSFHFIFSRHAIGILNHRSHHDWASGLSKIVSSVEYSNGGTANTNQPVNQSITSAVIWFCSVFYFSIYVKEVTIIKRLYMIQKWWSRATLVKLVMMVLVEDHSWRPQIDKKQPNSRHKCSRVVQDPNKRQNKTTQNVPANLQTSK